MWNPKNNEMKGFTNLCRTGTLRLQDKPNSVRALCMDIVTDLSNRDIPCNFDINHNDGGNLGVHEWVSQLGCVHLKYMQNKVQERIFEYAYHNASDIKDYFKPSVLSDKYQLSKKPKFMEFDNVVFLCGTNVLDVAIDFKKIKRICEQYPDAVIKPHPLTSLEHIEKLKTFYGKNRVLPHKMSGLDFLLTAKRVWIPSTSEFWFTALYHNKESDIITYNGFPGTYHSIINVVERLHYVMQEPKKDIVNKIISSSKSGIYTSMDEYHEHRDEYLETVLKMGGDFNNV